MALVNNQIQVPAAFSAGGSLSAEVGLAPYTLCGVASDANWTAEDISFLTSIDGTHWLTVQTNAGSLSYGTLQASSYMALDPDIFRGVAAIQVQSAANQTNNTTLTLIGTTVI